MNNRHYVVVIMLLAVALPQLYLWRWTVDDAFISFRYLANLASGYGLVFNPGERVEGFSHPLWMILLSPAAFISRFALITWAKLLGLVCTLGTGICLLRMLRRSVAAPAAIVAGLLLWHLSPGTHIYATCGLETPLLALLLTWALERSAVNAPPWQPAMLVGLAAILRPEAPLYAIAWLLTCRQSKTAIRAPALVLLLIPAIAWEIFRIAYYDAWLPNTFFAKPPGTFGGKFGVQYMLPLLAACSLPLVVLAHPSDKPQVRLAGAWCIAALVFVAYTQGDWMPFWRFLVPVWPAALLQLAVGIDVLHRKGIPVRRLVVACVVIGVLLQSTQLPSLLRGDGLYDLMRGTHQMKGGQWLAEHIKPGESAATVRLGALAWQVPVNPVHDIAGLTDRTAARHLWQNHGSIAWKTHPLAKDPPSWIAAVSLDGQIAYHGDADLTRDLADNYDLVGQVAQGPGAEWHFFHRKTASASRPP
ncbi:MAG: hypothetical protein ACR2IE_09830 [Candidatus Sumerlaeaceae bacterium]